MYQEKNIAENILYRLIPGSFVMLLILFNDLYIIDSKASLYVRLPVIILILIEWLFLLVYKKRQKLIYHTYNLILALTPIMMYGKILIHHGDETRVTASIIGAIIVLSAVVIELKTKFLYSIILFILPYLIFVALLIIVYDDKESIHSITINLTPFILIGVFANYLKNKQGYKLFKTNYLLNIEKDMVKELNEKVQVTNNELRKLDATRNKFFSIIAHDLKSPFNVILGYSNLLSEDYYFFTDEKRLKYIKEIEDSGNNTMELLDNLLIWARSQQGEIKIKKDKINLYIFISKIIEKHCTLAKTKAININIDIPIDINLNIDNYSFKTILINLLNNASKFTHAGGEISLVARSTKEFIEICIKDDGVGMSEDIRDNLFNLEKNQSSLGTNNEKGTGLGLILCKEFTEKNNGQIRVESEAGKGTSFILTFPIAYENL